MTTSRSAGEVCEYVHDNTRYDVAKVKACLESTHAWIWEEDLPGEVESATDLLQAYTSQEGLEAPGSHRTVFIFQHSS